MSISRFPKSKCGAWADYSISIRQIASRERRAHLASKADIGALDAKIEALRAELNTLKWIISIAIPAAIAITGLVVGIIVQLLNNSPAQ